MFQKILTMFLLIFLLSPSFTMSGDGNVPVGKKENINYLTETEKIYNQIYDLPQSNAKYDLDRIYRSIIQRREQLTADEVAELGRPNFQG